MSFIIIKSHHLFSRLELKKVHHHVLVSKLYNLLENKINIFFLLVHLRNIDASELEIVQFGLSFGKITNVLNLRKKNQVRI